MYPNLFPHEVCAPTFQENVIETLFIVCLLMILFSIVAFLCKLGFEFYEFWQGRKNKGMVGREVKHE
jgi:hypothetical protein